MFVSFFTILIVQNLPIIKKKNLRILDTVKNQLLERNMNLQLDTSQS